MWRWLSVVLLTLPPAAHALDAKAALRESQAAIGREVGNHRLTDGSGKSVRLADLRGKPLVVQFVYTGCFQVCPTTTQYLAAAVAQAERTLGPGTFRVATIGFNLPADSPEAMRDFGRRFGPGSPHWLFLSPEPKALDALVADFGFRYEPTVAGFDHLLQATIVDAEGRVYRQLYGDSFDAPRFTGALLELARNAPVPQGDLAAFIEQVRILCTVYDPSAGRYRLNYALLMQIAVGASVLLGGVAFLVLEWRRRRRVA
jgi:protein SCO1/2